MTQSVTEKAEGKGASSDCVRYVDVMYDRSVVGSVVSSVAEGLQHIVVVCWVG